MTDEIRAALDPVADAFEAMGIVYRVGGSVASSAFGVARTTLDVDLVAFSGRIARIQSRPKRDPPGRVTGPVTAARS